ncbi:hypothetical protein [Actinomadura harenae]|uniref:hypothetical protein n=1 Tax=Actinomadura harenae TaxID=2483351 RepID=UPI0018F2B9A1|nr:hypothetical protein [Actinomadura harenae]
MPRPRKPRAGLAVLTATLAALTALSAPAQANAAPPAPPRPPRQSADSGPAVRHDVSPPLRSIRPVPPKATRHSEPDDEVRLPHPPAAKIPDPVRQRSGGTTRTTSTASNFDGVGQGFTGPQGTYSVTGVPPDPNATVGSTQVVEVVNTAYAVFNKSTGTATYGPVNTSTLFSGFGGSCETTNDGDATVRWDTLASRWIVTQFANVSSASGPYYECVAVSTSADATGSYSRYSYQFTDFPDYPKISVWPDAYYLTYNLFNGNTFVGAEACAMDRSSMLTGAAATQQCFTTSSSYGGLLAGDLDGSTPPPSGENELLVGLGATNTSLAYWKFHVDWTTPANSTFTGPSSLTVASYTTACGSTGTCVPQSGTTQQLDSLSDRIMYRLAYRNFGDHEAFVTDHAVTVASAVGTRWYELRLSGGNPTVYQQGTYAPDSTYRWMGSIAMDHVGNIALGYSQSSSSSHPSIRFTGRAPADPLGTMTQAETTTITGAGSQTSYSRWGDYTSMAVDPSDDCTFWYTNEYEPANGSFNWHTRLTSFTLPGCASTPTNDFSISASPASGSVTAGGSATTTVSTAVTTGSAQTVTLAASGLPTGATASFSPSSVTSGGSSTATITTGSSTPAGTYPITITGTGTSATHSTGYTLTVNPVGGGGITNGGFETGSLSGWTASGPATSVTSTGPHGGVYAALLGSSSTATNGDSSIAQTFTAPTGTTKLSFYYNVTCPDTVTYDWATATLKDNTANTTTTVLAKTCVSSSGWKQVTSAVTAGHSYTLTLTSHDDDYSGDPTATAYDDVTLS